MKIVYITIYFLLVTGPVFSALVANTITPAKDLLAVVIMVKDEVDVIVPTLQPFINAGITQIFVYDTGSRDGTQEKINNCFKEHGITDAHIIEEPFVDFATSRNRALDLAEDLFPQTTFYLMLDAEWYTHNVDELINFCKIHKNYIKPGYDGSCYLIRLLTIQDSINNYIVRLIRRGMNVRYKGVVHETISQIPSGVVPSSVYFEYAPAQKGKDKSKNRFIRDREMLKKEHEKNPNDTRTLFYLGQTCQFLDEWEEAIIYYQKRLALGDLSEEKYLAAYRIGCAIEYLIETQNNEISKQYCWENAMHYYLIAHNMLPNRAEPLFRIACHYIRNKQHAIAYLFAYRAVQLPYPHDNSLFIEKKIYDHLRYDILGQCALYAGEYAIGKTAVLRALQEAPDDSCLHHNLSVYNRYCTE